MKRNGNDRKPGQKRLAFRKQTIRELTRCELAPSPGAGAVADPAAGADMATMFLTLPSDVFLC